MRLWRDTFCTKRGENCTRKNCNVDFDVFSDKKMC